MLVDQAGVLVLPVGRIPFLPAVPGALIDRTVAPADIQYDDFGPDLWRADLDQR